MAVFFFKKKKEAKEAKEVDNKFKCLRPEDIRVQLKPMGKYDAIRLAGRMLVERGSVEEGYIEAMIKREDTVSTYLADGVAIPHGIGETRNLIKSTGLVVLQFAGEGVPFGEEYAKLIVGIAGLGDEHLPILQAIAEIIMDHHLLEKLQNTDDPMLVYRMLTSGGEKA